MMKKIKIVIVIPTYNEGNNLQSLVENLNEELNEITEKFHIVIVDDNSTDGTGQIAENLKEKYNNIVAIHRKSKLGLGSAYKEGFRFALDNLELDYIVEMDADHSHDPKEIKLMVNKIEGHDFIIASRHVPGSIIAGWDARRKIIHNIAAFVARYCAKLDIKDSTSGFRMFTKNALMQINFSEIKSEGFAFQVEVLHLLKKKKLKGLELPTKFTNREKGKSKMGFTEMSQFTNMCLHFLFHKK